MVQVLLDLLQRNLRGFEQTINRDQKGPGEIIGSSASQRSMQRRLLSSHNTVTLIADFKRGIGSDSRKGSKELVLNAYLMARVL